MGPAAWAMHVPVNRGAAYLPRLSRPPELASGQYVTLSPLNKEGAEMAVILGSCVD